MFREPTLRSIHVQESDLPPPTETTHELWAWVNHEGYQRADLLIEDAEGRNVFIDVTITQTRGWDSARN